MLAKASPKPPTSICILCKNDMTSPNKVNENHFATLPMVEEIFILGLVPRVDSVAVPRVDSVDTRIEKTHMLVAVRHFIVSVPGGVRRLQILGLPRRYDYAQLCTFVLQRFHSLHHYGTI